MNIAQDFVLSSVFILLKLYADPQIKWGTGDNAGVFTSGGP